MKVYVKITHCSLGPTTEEHEDKQVVLGVVL